jgi:hypothetical protein
MTWTRVKLTQAARKHRVGAARIRTVIEGGEPVVVPADRDDLDDRLLWIGIDDRGVELEVIAVETDGLLLVLHAMPTHYRRRQS